MNSVRKSLSLVIALVLAFSAVNPAGAHTKVDKTSPAEGETVTAGEVTLEVSFTDKILDLANSSEIVLKGESESISGVGCISVTERGIKAEAFVGTAGTYKVSWRTVAEDGHPIDGDFSFTVTGSSKAESVTCKDGVTVKTPTATEPTEVTPTATPTTDSGEPGQIYNYLMGGGLVAVVIAIVVILRRRKATK